MLLSNCAVFGKKKINLSNLSTYQINLSKNQQTQDTHNEINSLK